jgi:hypothetical protein
MVDAMDRSTTAAVLNALPFPAGFGYAYLGQGRWVAVSVFTRIGAFLAGYLLAWGVSSAFGSYGEESLGSLAVALGFVAFAAPLAVTLALEARTASRLARSPGAPGKALVRKLIFGLLVLFGLIAVAVLIAIVVAPFSGGGF